MRRFWKNLAILGAILGAIGLSVGMILAMEHSGYVEIPPTEEAILAEPAPADGHQKPSKDGLTAWKLVAVDVDLVNLRDGERNATGLTASRGEVLAVKWMADGYGEISEPAKWAGLFIWRGCTSDPAGYGCEAK